MKKSIELPYINPLDDGRRKLTDDQKEEIRNLYVPNQVSLRVLAKKFGVNKSTIHMIVNESVKKANDERIRNHWRDYYTKEGRVIAMRKYREKKRRLGLISSKEK